MFDQKLGEQFARLKAEHAGALYRHYTLLRELDKVKEDLVRMEAGLAELERVKREWEAQKAIDEAAATQQQGE